VHTIDPQEKAVCRHATGCKQDLFDFDRARVPLRDDMIEECRHWYSNYALEEKEPLFTLLDRFKEPDDTAERKKSASNFREIWVSSFDVDTAYFPPVFAYNQCAESG